MSVCVTSCPDQEMHSIRTFLFSHTAKHLNVAARRRRVPTKHRRRLPAAAVRLRVLELRHREAQPVVRRCPGGLLPVRGVDLGRRDADLGRRRRVRRHRRQPHHPRRRHQKTVQLVVRKKSC